MPLPVSETSSFEIIARREAAVVNADHSVPLPDCL